MSKICINCGAQIPDSAGFCPNCGTAAPPDTPAAGSKFCPSCGSPLKPGAKFCENCGVKMSLAQPTTPVQQAAPPSVQPVQQQTYVQPAPPSVQPVQQQYQQPVQQPMQYQQPVQPAFVQPAMQAAGGTAVKTKKSKYPLIITIIAIFLAITLVVVLVFNPFGKAKSPLGEKLEASFSSLCDMTKLGSQSYAFARLLTEQLLETDLASADPNDIGSLFDQCLDAWKAAEEVSDKMISMSGELAADKGIQNAKVNTSKVSAVYAAPDLVDILFPFTVHASAADDDEVTSEVSAVASPAESVAQCSTLGMQILSDSQNGYTAVANLRAIYSGRTTPVQEWNAAVNTMAANFGMQFYVSGEITSGAFTTLPNGAHSVHTLSNTIKGGTVGVDNTDILIDIGDRGGCIVVGTTTGLTINQEQFPDYTPSEDSRTISINTYPEEPNENGVTFHATSFFSWFKLDRVGGFHITRGNKGEGSVTDPPVVKNLGGSTTYTPPETNRGPITEFIPPVTPTQIRETSDEITNPPSGNTPATPNTGGGSSQPPLTDGEITVIAGNLGAGVGPITVTLGWQTEDDLDLHVITPDESRIYYRNKTAQGGTLDVDMNARESEINIPAIENIFFPDPENGHYKVYLRDFRDRTSGTSTHWIIKVKVGDNESIYEGDIDSSNTEQFVTEFDYGGHGTESTLPPAPDSSTMGGTLVERGARTGKITVSTMWNRFDDVDLHCEAPGDAHIYYGNKTAGGGQLDVDANAGGQRILDPVENIYFENPRNGHYKVYLNQFADRSDDSASYLVRVDVDGEVREFSGTIDTTGTNVPIYEFDYNGAEETPAGEFGGHRYEYYPNADISWTQARAMCQSMGGHLVTITSAEEQAFIESTFPGTTGWIGAYGDNGGWSWVTGEQWSYTHWSPENPDNAAGTEWFGHLWNSMQWNDLDNDDPRNAQTGFYCEYDEYGDGTGVVSGNNGNNGSTVSPTSGGTDFSDAIPINVGQTVDNQSIEEAGQERVVYKFTTGEAGDYTITMKHPHDYFGTADAIFVLSDADKNRVSEEEWFQGETSKTYTLNGNSVYYLETWDYVIFTITFGASGSTDNTGGSGYWSLAETKYAIAYSYEWHETDHYKYRSNDSRFTTRYEEHKIKPGAMQFNEVEDGHHDYYIDGEYVDLYGEYFTHFAAYTEPKHYYSAAEEMALNCTVTTFATDPCHLTGEGTPIGISADIWTGAHTLENISFTQSNHLLDPEGDTKTRYHDYDRYNIITYKTNDTVTGTLKGAVPDPEDFSSDKELSFTVRVKFEDDMCVCYTYNWNEGAKPAEPAGSNTWTPTMETPNIGSNNGSLTESGINDQRTHQGAGSGKITISLMWDSEDDLDLHIFTPDGSELWWDNPNAQGGVFDIDANREGNIKSSPLENAYFANPVSGEYWIYVYNYEDRTPGKSTNWIVRVQVGDEEQIYSGTITNQEETIEVLGFNYTSSVG